MYRVEPGEVVAAGVCSCCGRAQRSTFGFVHSGDETVAFYYALLEPSHRAGRAVTLTVSIGDWGHEADPATRTAATLRARRDRGDIEMTLAEPAESPYRDRAVLGRMLGAGEVTTSVLCEQIIEISESIVLEDPEVNEHLTSSE